MTIGKWPYAQNTQRKMHSWFNAYFFTVHFFNVQLTSVRTSLSRICFLLLVGAVFSTTLADATLADTTLADTTLADNEQTETQSGSPRGSLKKALYKTLAESKTEQEGRQAEDAVWVYWFDQAPTPEVRSLLDNAIERREAYDFEAAENLLDDVVDQAPDYAEGFNQRAFIRFLRENFTDAQADLDRTLALEPDHFGAHAGLYQIFSRRGEQEKAFNALRTAVGIHPWLRERSGLPEAWWPQSYRNIHTGQDI